MMRITRDTPVSELYHSDGELYHWKYIKREKVNGKWKYYYDEDSLKSDIKTTATNITNAAIKKANNTSKKIDDIVSKARAAINKYYDNPKNMYDVSSSSYEEKMAKVKETKEWKDIVARSDPEYIRKNADGSTSYLIDDYVTKKKHPVLDVLSDIAAGRNVDVNEITKDSAVAGMKDYAIGYLRTGMLAAGVLSTYLTQKFKLQQGSYDDEIRDLTATIERGVDYTKTIVEETPAISQEQIEIMATAVRKGSMVAEATRTINEGNVVKAAQTIMESDMIRDTVGNNEYYKLAESALTNLSEEEIAALNLLLKQLRTQSR